MNIDDVDDEDDDYWNYLNCKKEFKTVLCRNYMNDIFCDYKEYCIFAHGYHEIKCFKF